uniref:Uncharacterized protein n=1 Tax=Opuntia streptacantha TaxID=393608 RepID=A0A7C8ZYJ9_OPUST
MEAQQYHYQYQTHNDANSAPLSLSYSPSQLHSYDQSTQPYYAYHHHHFNQPQQREDYSSYYYPDYSNSYTTHHAQNDPTSIHPPGVPFPAETQQSHLQNSQSLYHQHGVSAAQPPPSQAYMLNSIVTSQWRGEDVLSYGIISK